MLLFHWTKSIYAPILFLTFIPVFLGSAQTKNQVKLADQEYWEIKDDASLKRISEDFSQHSEFLKLSKERQEAIRSFEKARVPIISDAFAKFGKEHNGMHLLKVASHDKGFFGLFYFDQAVADDKPHQDPCDSPISSDDHSYILAWNLNGSINTNFGNQGILDLSATQLTSLFIHQGKILVAGYFTEYVADKPPQTRSQNRFFVRKYESNGKALDASFANRGVLTFPQSTPLNDEICGSILGEHQIFIKNQSKGDFVVVGALGSTNEKFIPSYFITRYNQNGNPSKTFGSFYQNQQKSKIAGTIILKGVQSIEQITFSTDGGLLIVGTLHSSSHSMNRLKGFFIYDAAGKNRLWGIPFVAAPELEFSK